MKLLTLVLLLLFITTSAYSQGFVSAASNTSPRPKKAIVIKGDWSDLAGIKEYNLVFDYEGMEVVDYDSEEAYLEMRVKDKNEKEAESGNKYKEKWFKVREEGYKPDFIKGFNKNREDIIAVRENSDLEYTMEIKTTQVYTGWTTGVGTKSAKLFIIINVYRTDDPSDVIFSATKDRIWSSNSKLVAQYTDIQRISNAYYIVGEYFKAELNKKIK